MAVRWSPVWESEFAVFKQDLRIYRYGEKDKEYSPGLNDISLSDSSYGRLAYQSKDYGLNKSQRLAWAALHDRPHTFAVSHLNGQIEVVSFDSGKETKQTILNPRMKRTCTALEWNQTQPSYLAVGYKVDKMSRSEGSLFVVNVDQTPTSSSVLQPGSTGGLVPSLESTTSKTVLEQGGESISSLCWLPWEPNLVATSMGKVIRIYDIRDEIKTQRPTAASAQIKATGGLELSADPFSTYRLSTYTKDHGGSGVTIWDTRHLSRPLFTFFRNNSTIAKVEWSPTQSGRLALLTVLAPFLHFIDIPTGSEEWLEADANEFNLRTRNCSLTSQSVDLNWHWKWHNSLLTLSGSGDVKVVQVSEPSPLTWDPWNKLAHVETDNVFHKTFTSVEESNDISTVMRDRATRGYGFDATANIGIVENDVTLRRLWSWLDKQHRLVHSERIPSTCNHPLAGSQTRKTIPGVLPLLSGEFNAKGTCSQAQRTALGPHIGNIGSEVPDFEIYTSTERHQCMLICGWDLSPEGLESFFKREEMKDRHERAAALSVFNGYIEHSISSLKYGANITAHKGETQRSTMLTMAALALAGYNSKGVALWQRTCKELKDTLKEPYLRAMFSFLSSKNSEDFLAILEDDGITYQDRVGFATMYFNRNKLMSFLERLRVKLIEGGHLEGLFLTGINEDSLRLLSKYIDKTSDIQTACMVAGQAADFVSKDRRVMGWFKCYRELLNKWRLWHSRVRLDIAQKGRDHSKSVPGQVFLSCNFCGKNINSSGSLSSTNVERKSKVNSCPQCGKPLPRCAICLMYMGMGASSVYSYKSSTGERMKSAFDHWFTWCQTCRHGGHAAHILEWFNHHTECPVSQCQCRCMLMDGKGEQDFSTSTVT